MGSENLFFPTLFVFRGNRSYNTKYIVIYIISVIPQRALTPLREFPTRTIETIDHSSNSTIAYWLIFVNQYTTVELEELSVTSTDRGGTFKKVWKLYLWISESITKNLNNLHKNSIHVPIPLICSIRLIPEVLLWLLQIEVAERVRSGTLQQLICAVAPAVLARYILPI